MKQSIGTSKPSPQKVDSDELMIPFRALLLQRLICSAWSIGAIALVTASLLEWGVVVAGPERLL
jgi:hypothetical protein